MELNLVLNEGRVSFESMRELCEDLANLAKKHNIPVIASQQKGSPVLALTEPTAEPIKTKVIKEVAPATDKVESIKARVMKIVTGYVPSTNYTTYMDRKHIINKHLHGVSDIDISRKLDIPRTTVRYYIEKMLDYEKSVKIDTQPPVIAVKENSVAMVKVDGRIPEDDRIAAIR